MKLLLTADIHASNFLPYARTVQDEFDHRCGVTDRLLDACDILRQIGLKALYEECDEIWILGDLFDKRMLDGATLKFITDYLAIIASKSAPIHIIPGNHEMTTAAGQLYTVEYLEQIPEVFIHSVPEQIKRGRLSISICPYMRLEEYVGALEGLEGGDYLFTHQAIVGAKQGNHRVDSGLGLDMLARWRKTLMGHFHDHQWLCPGIGYLGSPWQIKHGEDEDKFIWFLDCDEDELSRTELDFPPFETKELEWPEPAVDCGLSPEDVCEGIFEFDGYQRLMVTGADAPVELLKKLDLGGRHLLICYTPPMISREKEQIEPDQGLPKLDRFIDKYAETYASEEDVEALKDLGRRLCWP